ncbi:MAG: preprotein translocase subunit SecD, partial [Blastocatellia bacterium]|nr:preprotein translocase subunit SecD [Blastocatellia bacterium]
MKKKNLKQRVAITVIVTLIGLYVVFAPHGRRPHRSDFTLAGIKSTLAQNIKLGLDLKGGSHLVMRVKTDEYLKKLTENDALAAENAAKTAGFEVKETRAETSGGTYRITLVPGDPSKANEIKEAVEKKVELNSNLGWSYSASGGALAWSLGSSAQRTMADQATEQALRIIDSRINAVGVAEPTLQHHGAQGSHQILLQMPGIQD